MKRTGVHGRHGVVEKKQSRVGDKVWIGKRMVLFEEIYGIMGKDKETKKRG